MFVVLFGVLLTGCAKKPPPITVVLRDDARLFNRKDAPHLIEQLRTLSVEKELAIVLRTIPESRVSGIGLAAYFDQIYENDAEWRPVSRPASWWQFGRKFNPPDNALELIAVAKPSFVAWRFGREARWRAFVSGLMISNSTLEIQRRAQGGDVTGAVQALIAELEKSLPAPKALSKLQQFASSEYGPEMQEIMSSLTMNRWNWYNKCALKPVLQLQFFLSRYIWPRQAPLLAVVISLLLAQCLLWVLRKALGIHWAGKLTAMILSVVVEILSIAPSVGSLLLLAHGRLEDQMFVRGLLNESDQVTDFVTSGSSLNFVGQTGLWMALVLAIAGVLSSLARNHFVLYSATFPKDVQKRMYESLDPAGKAFLYLTAFDEDAQVDSLGEKAEPYAEVAGAVCIKIVKGYFGRAVVFSVIPLGASLVLAKRSVISLLNEFMAVVQVGQGLP